MMDLKEQTNKTRFKIIEEILRVMKREKVSQKELAEKIGISVYTLTRILDPHDAYTGNTIRTLVKIASALDMEWQFTLCKKKEGENERVEN